MIYFDKQINLRQNILKKSYQFINNCYIDLDEDDCAYTVNIEPKKRNLALL